MSSTLVPPGSNVDLLPLPSEGGIAEPDARRGARRKARALIALETIGILGAPGFLYAVLRLRGMAPVELPDPSMHTTYIVDPRDIFSRYSTVLAPTARLREGAQVGFLVPARVAYLLFGAIGGFFTFRYVLALVAIVPLYVLMRRLYGRWAGFLAAALVMSNPVFVTAWGSDYPNSAAISYLAGGLAALAMPCRPERRPLWLACGGSLFTLAVWSHGASVPLAGAGLVAYAVVRLIRQRDHLLRDAAVLVGAAVCVTGALALCSSLLLGQLNFISPTLGAERYLSTAAQEALWHSTNWRWVLYDPYLLVPLAALVAFFVVFADRWRSLGSPQLFIGLAGVLDAAISAFLQFGGKVQTLEIYVLSSLLWSSVVVVLALTLAEMASPFAGKAHAPEGDRADASWSALAARKLLPALLIVVVALGYEADPHVPTMKLVPWGLVVLAIIAVSALIWLLLSEVVDDRINGVRKMATLRGAVTLLLIVVIAGACLVLTVAPIAAHAPIVNTRPDPPPAYATALGGSDTVVVDEYQVVSELPGFVGHPSYPGELLLMWWPSNQLGPLLGPIGIFHAGFNSIAGAFPTLDAVGKSEVESRRPAQLLLMSVNGYGFPQAVRSLAPFGPDVVRRGVLVDGGVQLHVWLVDLTRYLHRPAR